MKINIAPNLDQIRSIAEAALHAWDYQELEAGRAQVIDDMTMLLRYLDALNNGEGVAVAGISGIETGIRIERSTREGDFFDLTQRYRNKNVDLQVEGHEGRRVGIGVGEQRMRVVNCVPAVDRQDDFRSIADRAEE